MDKKNEIQKTKLLLVEGNHERDVFEAWLKDLKRNDIQIMPIAGRARLRNCFWQPWRMTRWRLRRTPSSRAQSRH